MDDNLQSVNFTPPRLDIICGSVLMTNWEERRRAYLRKFSFFQSVFLSSSDRTRAIR